MTPEGFGEVAESLRRSTVHVQAPGPARAGGSGVIWSPDGLVITNAHVARGERAAVGLWDGRQFEGAVAVRDTKRDLAGIRIDAENLPAAAVRDSGSLSPGELVIAVGNPLGFTGALSTGVVHAVGPVSAFGVRKWVQADVRLMPGNSGGPLADARGRVIGINTMIAGRLALAVPSDTVEEFLRRGESPSLGVVVQPVAIDRDLGLLVVRVEPSSAAERASLLPGDVLLGTDGRRFGSPDDLTAAIEASAGKVLALDFVRGERIQTRHVAVRIEPWKAIAA